MSGKVNISLGDLLLKISFSESQGLINFFLSVCLGMQPPPACCACYWDSYYRKWYVRIQAGLAAAVLLVSGLH